MTPKNSLISDSDFLGLYYIVVNNILDNPDLTQKLDIGPESLDNLSKLAKVASGKLAGCSNYF